MPRFSSTTCPVVMLLPAHATPSYVGERCTPGIPGSDPLYVTKRAQVNYSENVPQALLLTALIELNGGKAAVVHGALTILFIVRVIHVQYGMMAKEAIGQGRRVGFSGTSLVFIFLAGYAGLLTIA